MRYNKQKQIIGIEKWLDEDSVIENEELQNLRQILTIEQEIKIIREFLIEKFGNQLPENYLTQLEQFELKKLSRKTETQEYNQKKVPLNPNNWTGFTGAQLRAFFEYIGMEIPVELTTKKQISDYIKSQVKEWPDEDSLLYAFRGPE